MTFLCYVVAMEAEAQPFIAFYAMQERKGFFAPLPCRLWECEYESITLYVVTPGRHHDRDLIGCEAAAMTTTAIMERLHPDMIINSGTCGAWARHGMHVGQVCIGSCAMFHDRRVPGDNAWATQGLGNYQVWQGSKRMAEALGLAMGKVTTGSSFDMTKEDEQTIESNGGQLKEMEGAAVAFVCSQYGIPVVLVKAVTNLRDAPDDDMETFHNNLRTASEALLEANKQILSYLAHATL